MYPQCLYGYGSKFFTVHLCCPGAGHFGYKVLVHTSPNPCIFSFLPNR